MTRSLLVRVVLATTWFALLGCYTVISGLAYRSWPWCLLGLAALIGATGIPPRWAWAEWVIYVLTVGLVGYWTFRLVWAIAAGSFPYETLELTALGLVPGFALLAPTIWSADIVRRRYRQPSTPSNPSWSGREN